MKDPATGRYWIAGHHCDPADPPGTGRALGKYTAWSGAWLLADNRTVMHSFMQSTGPTAPYPKTCPPGDTRGRDVEAATQLRARHEHAAHPNVSRRWPELAIVLRGWRDRLASDPIYAAADDRAARASEHGRAQGHAAAPRQRRRPRQQPPPWGGPETAFLQRHAPGANVWIDLPTPYGQRDSRPEALRLPALTDRRLLDGRLIAPARSGTRRRATRVRRPPYQLAADGSGDEGATWTSALTVPPRRPRATSGTWRRSRGAGHRRPARGLANDARRHPDPHAGSPDEGAAGRTTTTTGTPNTGEGWVMQQPAQTPAQLPHSGHPELLAARVGGDESASVIIDFATTGVDYTRTGGDLDPLPFGSDGARTATTRAPCRRGAGRSWSSATAGRTIPTGRTSTSPS